MKRCQPPKIEKLASYPDLVAGTISQSVSFAYDRKEAPRKATKNLDGATCGLRVELNNGDATANPAVA
jgi:hypothetical protein